MSKIPGIVQAIVADLDDPERLGRIRVTFPWLDDQPSDWARIVAPLAGKDRGWVLRPEVGDEVIVAFAHGDPRFPYVIGGAWNVMDPPPADDGRPTENNWRFFRSRSGHQLKFDDTSGAERIEIVGSGENHRVVIDVSGQKIEISCAFGDVSISAPAGRMSIDANQIEINATSTLSLQAGAALTVKGATVAIN